jgi:hypothetical protein
MMVRMDFGSRSRENNDSDGNDVNIYGHVYDSMDQSYIQRFKFKLDMSLSLVVCDKNAMLLQRNNLYSFRAFFIVRGVHFWSKFFNPPIH